MKVKPVVFSSFHLNTFVDSAVDGGLGSMPAVLADEPGAKSYDQLLIPRVVSEEVCAYQSGM